MRTVSASNTPISSLAPTSSSIPTHRLPWHSPLPYLFGGLAAMMSLVVFALLILACSYWKLCGHLRNEEGSDRDLQSGGGEKEGEAVKVYEETMLVIMAGDEKPTFLATPVCAKSSSFVDEIENSNEKEIESNESCEKSDEEMDNRVHVEATARTENENPQETQLQNQ